MSLFGYKKKGKPANWTSVPGARVRGPAKAEPVKYVKPISKKRQVSSRQYTIEARLEVKAANQRGERCPVVNTIPELKAAFKYGHPVSDRIDQIHHIYGRGHGGRGPLLMDKRLWFPTSKQGHRWIDANKERARYYGWLAPVGHYNTPVGPEAIVRRNQWNGVEVIEKGSLA